MKKVYGLWLLAFGLKLFGSAWDTSWHFKYFFDTFSPPHNVNTVGFLLAWALVGYHCGGTAWAQRQAARLPAGLQRFTRKWVLLEHLGSERHMDRGSLILTTTGLFVFLVAAPIDQVWHRIFGLDLTTWSPTHLGLFAGTELAILGVLMGVYRHGRTNQRGSFDSIALLCLGGFLLEAFLFACGQQEYGYITLYAINHPDYVNVQHMTTFPIPALLAAAQNQGGAYALATGNVPAWIYPFYQLLMVTAILQFMRLLHHRAWTGTAVAALYLAYRLLARFLLHSFDFPISFVPYYLIGIGLSLDIAGALALLTARFSFSGKQAPEALAVETAPHGLRPPSPSSGTPPAPTSEHAGKRGRGTRVGGFGGGTPLGATLVASGWGALAAAGATASVYGGAAMIQRFEVMPPIPLGSPQYAFFNGGFPIGFLLACLGLWIAAQVVALFAAQARRQQALAAAEARKRERVALAAKKV
ncbi:MAG TPA: hypothetical protein VFU69_08480 [Ktedonobacterales bacterium]|nr:hypothetical protein [Ktedonobacterales bacterium]